MYGQLNRMIQFFFSWERNFFSSGWREIYFYLFSSFVLLKLFGLLLALIILLDDETAHVRIFFC